MAAWTSKAAWPDKVKKMPNRSVHPFTYIKEPGAKHGKRGWAEGFSSIQRVSLI